jgi:hypothetical protein
MAGTDTYMKYIRQCLSQFFYFLRPLHIKENFWLEMLYLEP